MITTHQIGSGRPLFELPKGRFFEAMTQRLTLTRMGNGWVEVSPPPYDRDIRKEAA
ncbi:MAG: hypothetical protein P0Y65_05590 [Candidatus Devosia phytovorans]|uniref:Uncharacterized protein n=1 Tax=Candidatus Devosia phytovorans TaxID=3121372 RepID=A0AAJ5VWJ5_9HYPH|nr:hypothetical protein [Devosia sp.]WEK05727.1 MAG: hypothetical protein P0Y65_05590 [Devosia sp.]